MDTPVEAPPLAAQERRLIPTIYVVIGVVLVLALAIIFTLIILWVAQTQAATVAALRDIVIIALALESCVFGIVVLLMFIMLVRLVNMLEFEIKPILLKTSETLGTIRGTTTFVSKNVVEPVTTATSYVAGLRQGLRALFGDPRKNLVD